MATPCSGKTTLFRSLRASHGFELVDFSQVHRRAVARPESPEGRLARGSSYHERLASYLRNVDRPVAVLGRQGPDRIGRLGDATLGAVLIPIEDHRRNSRRRREAVPDNQWGDFSNVLERRKGLAAYARRHGLPVFDSFEGALEELARASPVDAWRASAREASIDGSPSAPPVPIVYLLALPTSRTEFTAAHRTFAGLDLVDVKSIADPPSTELPVDAETRLLRHLRTLRRPTCVLGRRMLWARDRAFELAMGVVLLPEAEQRRERERVAADRPRSRWADPAFVETKRRKLRRLAVEEGLPLFSGFEEAIRALAPASSPQN